MIKYLALAFLAACPSPRPPKRFDALAPGDHVSDGTAYHVMGTGPTCVVEPGGPGLDWKYLRSPELEAKLQLVYVEPIGTGGSDRLPSGQPYVLARYVDQLEHLRKVLQMDQMCLIGHSHGGTVVTSYAIAHPDRVSTLVLYSAPNRFDKAFGEAGEKNLERWKDEAWYAEARKAFDTDPKSDAEATKVWPLAMKFLFADYTGHADAYARAVVPMYYIPVPTPPEAVDLRPDLGTITAPTLVIEAAMDWCCGAPYGKELAAGIKGAKLERFEHSGHMSHLEEPDHFAQAVSEFVIGSHRSPAEAPRSTTSASPAPP